MGTDTERLCTFGKLGAFVSGFVNNNRHGEVDPLAAAFLQPSLSGSGLLVGHINYTMPLFSPSLGRNAEWVLQLGTSSRMQVSIPIAAKTQLAFMARTPGEAYKIPHSTCLEGPRGYRELRRGV